MLNSTKRLVILLIVGLFILIGCGSYGGVPQHDENVFRVKFLTSLPTNITDPMVEYIESILGDDLPEDVEVEVILGMASFDALTVEILNREADFLIVDDGFDNVLIDPYYLEPLDRLEDQVTVDIERFRREHEDTGITHLYALPLTEASQFRRDTGFDLPFDLITGIVDSSPHQDLAFKLLEAWIEEE